MSKTKKILISGGGTGGHIYPAIAIANEIKSRYPKAEFLFVGASDKMEMEKVPQAGYEIKGLWIAGLQRKLTLQNLLFPIKLIFSLLKSYGIVKRFKPQIAIGTGGFASGAALFVAGKLGVSTVIQEQNSYPGITNKLLAKQADKICVAYEGLSRFFPKETLLLTGNPVRQDLLNLSLDKDEAQQYFGLDKNKKTLLVLGGSLGARAINQMIEENIEKLQQADIQVIWQTGKFYIEEYKKYDELEGVQTHAFLSKMDLAYTAADIIVSRAGASSVSELCLVAKPVIFIPSPNVAEDHQTKNAKAIADAEGAVLIKESEKHTFFTELEKITSDEVYANRLSKNIKQLAKPNATVDIVNEIEKIAGWI